MGDEINENRKKKHETKRVKVREEEREKTGRMGCKKRKRKV